MTSPPPDVPQKIALSKPAGRFEKAARKEERLKAALKANMAKRKAQVRAKAGAAENDNDKE